MTSNLEIIPSIEAHVHELSKSLREGEIKEIATFHNTPLEALLHSYKVSHLRYTALVNGKVAAMWGVQGSLLGQEGHPFLLTGRDSLLISSLKFVRIYLNQLNQMKSLFPVLWNYVDADYKEAVRLLKIAGFTLEPVKVLNKDMFKFTMVSE